MHTAINIAYHLLDIAHRNGDCITNLKLQKLLYYAQAWFMVNNNGKLLFEDDIEAWKYGPVVRSVYDNFKKYNSSPIEISKRRRKIKPLEKNEEIFLEEFSITFYKFSASELVAMTHNERPWIDAYSKSPNSVIDTSVMYEFYKSMLDEK